jgi:uncharacterized protein YqhQ
VMMRSPRYFSVACRAPNKEIVLRTEALEKTWVGRQKWLKKPFLRGTLALIDAMGLGIKAMKFASSVQLDEEFQDPDHIVEVPTTRQRRNGVIWAGVMVLIGLGLLYFLPAYLQNVVSQRGNLANYGQAAWVIGLLIGAAIVFNAAVGVAKAQKVVRMSDQEWLEAQKAPSKALQDLTVGATIVVSIGMGLAIFQYAPNLISQNLQKVGWGGTAINFVTEIIKIVFFLGYIWLIGQMKEIQEVFKYHGAEHKAINTMEAGEELTLENCKRQTRLHPRCGTSFAIVVLIVSMVIFTFVPRYPLGEDHLQVVNATIRFGLELLILPLISGISYELIRFAGKFRNQKLVQGLFWPGLMSQYLTTREPEDGQIEVALLALQAVVDAEHGHAAQAPEIDVDSAPAQIA